MYSAVLEKKITPTLWNSSLKSIVWKEIKDAKIIIMYTPEKEKVQKKKDLVTLSKEIENSTLRFETTQDAMHYLHE